MAVLQLGQFVLGCLIVQLADLAVGVALGLVEVGEQLLQGGLGLGVVRQVGSRSCSARHHTCSW